MNIKPFMKTNVNVVNKKTHEPTDFDYYIGRPSPLGNPYTHLKDSKYSKFVVNTRDEAILMYETHLYSQLENNNNNNNNKEFTNAINEILKIYEKYGKINLVCFCKPKTCHGDYIKKLIDDLLKNKKNIMFQK